jgi:hypothetical protein
MKKKGSLNYTAKKTYNLQLPRLFDLSRLVKVKSQPVHAVWN